jgi:ABC-type sugar transport system substrate-binding protein
MRTKLLAVLGMASAMACFTQGAARADADKPVIGVIELFGNPFFAEARKGMKSVAEKDGAELLIENANSNVGREAELVQTFIRRQVDVILISAQSATGSIAALKLAKDAGIPVVCWNTCIRSPEDKQLVKAFVTSDNKKIGEITGTQVADYVRQQLGGKATLLMLTCQTFDTCKDRRAGINKALAGPGLDIKLADEQEGFQVDKARPIADAMLTAHPDVQVFIGENDDGTIAAGQAVDGKGMADKIKVFGIDINPQVAHAIVDPKSAVVWTTGQDPYAMGASGVELALKQVRGKSLGDFYQFTASPAYSKKDMAAAQKYIETH